MDNPSTALRGLRETLRRGVLSGAPQKRIEDLRDKVAELLLNALFDERHPLSRMLAELEDVVDADRKFWLSREGKELAKGNTKLRVPPSSIPERLFFMPHPGITNLNIRRLWPLQLLLQTAAYSKTHVRFLADKLLMSVKSMHEAAKAGANACSVAMWSEQQYWQNLEQAVGELEVEQQVLPVRLEGRHLFRPVGKPVRLSAQEATMLRLLIDHLGRPVQYSAFQEAGIQYPTQMKQQLERKLSRNDIRLQIKPALHAYILSVAEQ